MSKTNLIRNSAIAAAVSVVFGASAVKAETINATIGANIVTGFTFLETQQMNFGDIAVLKAIGAADVTVAMSESTSVRTTSDSATVAILAGLGEEATMILDATIAPPFTLMLVTIPTQVDLTLGTNPAILLGSFVENAGGVTTDGAGALTLEYGGTLAFSNGATYGSGLYTNAVAFPVVLSFP